MAELPDLRYGFDVAGLDPLAMAQALRAAGRAAARHPRRIAASFADLALTQMGVGGAAAQRLLGGDPPSPARLDEDDRRFADRAWTSNPFMRAVGESYAAVASWSRALLESLDLDAQTKTKARFALGFLLDAVAPTNLPWLNPAVVKEAIDTGGLSVARGVANFTADVVRNGGRPRQVDTTPFEVGRNLAATPGRVVMRNELMELIAYEPQTEQVHEEPILCSPPWINKYYIMDLAPGRSFIEYAVQHGFTVFAISYRNPDSSMARVTMDDYLRDGLLASLDRAREITGSHRVNVVGLCLGGTLTTIGLAHLAALGDADAVGWATLTNTLVDFADPGELGAFTDERTVTRLEEKMRRRGYLDASQMSGTFDWLRGNDLVWSYVVSNWYMGKQPAAFDILAWNSDSTRMPAAMHSQYLRSCYLENALVVPGALTIGGTPIDLAKVETPLYVLGAEGDHIAPWRSAYQTTQVVGGDVRFVLTSSGHIAGMVNPPGNQKAAHWVRDGCPDSAEAWSSGAEKRTGSWWENWAEWATERSGPMVAPPRLPLGEPAPGSYVRG